ncbi:zinc-binding dehydrogenase [Nonomuraea sp. NPDC000554]|uniref:zinc-binding dehydrogenase n=1 Tax=Nonomuraea sp. NPDC000554 TaxID=3154259 RepID=UPI00331BFFA7
MKVVEVTRFGGPEVLQAGSAPDPVAGPGQLVVGVAVVDVMSLDAQLRAGWGQEWFPSRPPFVPGTGVAGHVLSVGEGVDASWVGRRVAALVPGGGYAERAVADAATVVAVPDRLSLRQAAALVQVGPAALSLTDAAELKPGARVLVLGAGGALGLPLVALANAAGAHVTAAAHGTSKRAAAVRFGAAETVDYGELAGIGSGPAWPGGYDVVFDGVGGQVGTAAFRLVARGGTFFAYGVPSGSTAAVDPGEAERRGVRLVGMEQVQFAPDEFRDLAERTLAEAAAGRLATLVGLAVPLERAREAHAALESRELVGKAVLLVTSRAVRYTRHGGSDVLSVDEVAIPEPGPGQVRVAVRAAGVNPIDWKIRRGFVGGAVTEPTGTGMEVAGTIDALGPGVEGWRTGQPVFGRVPAGAAADHVLADPRELLRKPDGLPYALAAALPVAVETAHRVLRQLVLRPGQTLLIHAVAGGVGLVAAQLAIARGARVVGTASERHHAFLRGLGVHPVTYGEGLEERLPRPIDLVLDASGRDVLELSVHLTGDPGKVITIADFAGAAEHGVRFSTGSDGQAIGEIFADVLPLVARGAVRMPIAREFPLERTADAHRLSEDGHLLGKIVLITEPSLPR